MDHQKIDCKVDYNTVLLTNISHNFEEHHFIFILTRMKMKINKNTKKLISYHILSSHQYITPITAYANKPVNYIK